MAFAIPQSSLTEPTSVIVSSSVRLRYLKLWLEAEQGWFLKHPQCSPLVYLIHDWDDVTCDDVPVHCMACLHFTRSFVGYGSSRCFLLIPRQGLTAIEVVRDSAKFTSSLRGRVCYALHLYSGSRLIGVVRRILWIFHILKHSSINQEGETIKDPGKDQSPIQQARASGKYVTDSPGDLRISPRISKDGLSRKKRTISITKERGNPL